MNLPVIVSKGKSIKYSSISDEFHRAFDDCMKQLDSKNSLLDRSTFRPILSKPGSNTKLAKTTERTIGYRLYSLFLAPAGVSGYNTCAWATDECRRLCLNTSGRGAMQNVQDARIAKTKLMVEQPYVFMASMISEMVSAMKSCAKTQDKLAIRMNGTSDIPWEFVAPFIEGFCVGGNMEAHDKLSKLPRFTLYDYTKSLARMKCRPQWYDLTLSYSGHNWKDCKFVLDNEIGRVAMVFYGDVPEEYEGYKVVRGDDDDYRFLDDPGLIVGLTYKSTGKENDSLVDSCDSSVADFVVRVNQ